MPMPIPIYAAQVGVVEKLYHCVLLYCMFPMIIFMVNNKPHDRTISMCIYSLTRHGHKQVCLESPGCMESANKCKKSCAKSEKSESG